MPYNSQKAFERAWELLDLTPMVRKNKGRFREVARVREAFRFFHRREGVFINAGSMEKIFLAICCGGKKVKVSV